MSYAGGKRGGDMVLESRHLVGLFLLIVVISGVLFTLGYILGRSQRHLQAQAATSSSPSTNANKSAGSPTSTPSDSAAGVRSDWAFYSPTEPRKDERRPESNGGASSSINKPAGAGQSSPRLTPSKGKALLHAPLVPRGAIVLQVAAMTREGDALLLAEALQKKKFPAFVLTPGADQYYRIQVGPYGDARSAEIARRGLEQEGFKAMYKR